jgi:hypothetical protein
VVHKRPPYSLPVRFLPNAHNQNLSRSWVMQLNGQKPHYFTRLTRQKRGQVVDINRILNNRFLNPEPIR